MNWDWAYAISILPRLLNGLTITLQIVIVATLISTVLGLVLAIAKMSAVRPVATAASWLIDLIRLTPLLVQLFLIYYALPDVGVTLSPFAAGAIAIGLYNGAHMAEVYRAGIESVPRLQWEAAKALNLDVVTSWRHIILPQALPPIVAALGNYLIVAFKLAALLYSVSLMDMMGVARVVGNESYRYFEPMTVVGILYLLVSLPTGIALRRLERYLRMRFRLE